MAANKFATILHRNTNRMTLILTYVALEWLLIIMLLLNALFSYLILKFAHFFGLKTPCIWCSRIDHIFEPKKSINFHRDLLCEAHASEISKLGYCSNHLKLVESEYTCEDCSSSQNLDFFKGEVNENGEMNFNCSCCGMISERRNYSYTLKGISITEAEDDDEFEESETEFVMDRECQEEEPIEGEKSILVMAMEDQSSFENHSENRIKEQDYEKCGENLGYESNSEALVEPAMERVAEIIAHEIEEEAKYAVFESLEMGENQDTSIFHTKICDFVCEISKDVQEEERRDLNSGAEAADQTQINEPEEDVSIGTEIPDLESTVEFPNQETLPPFTPINEHGIKQVEEEIVELKTISIDAINHQTSLGSELNDIEEKIPGTPSSIESLHHLYKKLLFLEKKDLGTEESYDGSVISELEGDEGVMNVERLISALKAERMALNVLYAELEEERSANAIAANQTLAMINRLQEEKAAIEIEAFQYQRMMEEQSEYDQEALHLLNELMAKSEKEKREMEKELEAYRKRVLEFEGKENPKMMEKAKDDSSRSESPSYSSSNFGDSDGLSIDTFEENGHHETPIKEILNLDDSSVNFEEERLFILHQLKVLEEKLFSLAEEEEEEEHNEEVKHIDHLYEENGNHIEEVNGNTNGFPKKMNGKHELGRRTIGVKGKRLLPLFQSVENGHVNGFGSYVLQSHAVESIELENEKRATEEEFDGLYERLLALEADREFLKHCILSLRKGGKGVDLLQEILQLLRYLRNEDNRVRNLSNDDLVQNFP